MQLETIYKYNNKGKVQQWTIVVDGNEFYTEEGLVDGKITKSLPTVCWGKNLGKKNETSDNEQVIAEAQSKWDKKISAGYYKKEDLVDKDKFVEPMLAHSSDNVELDFENKVYYVQPKFDGLRCISHNNTLMSRNGKPYLACPHLYQDEVMLDGELYSHEYHDDFNKIVSLCKKQKPTMEQLEESENLVRHYVYDMPLVKGKFSERYAALQKWHKTSPIKDYVVVVDTYLISNQEELDKYHSKFLSDGYEGTIIREDNNDYEFKRSKQLIKYKDFMDEEFKIIGAEEGKGGRTGTIGKFYLEHDKDERGSFESNVKGDFKYLAYLWEHKDEYMGKMATVKYFNRTPFKEDGTGDKPRFPFIIKIDRDSYE